MESLKSNKVSGQQLFSWPISCYCLHLFKWSFEVTQRTMLSSNTTLSKARHWTVSRFQISLEVEGALFVCFRSVGKLLTEDTNTLGW